MATLNDTQRDEALDVILKAYASGDAAVAAYLPGTTAAEVRTFIKNAIGTNADAQLDAILKVLVANQQTDNSALQSQLTAGQANIATWTGTGL